MDVAMAIEKRRAVKRFEPDYVIPEEDERRLFELTLLSPTAFNIQHWRFVVVRDRELREKIRAVTWGQPQITEASLLVVVCADVQAWQGSGALLVPCAGRTAGGHSGGDPDVLRGQPAAAAG